MSASNTLNICLSHIPLPESLCAHVDVIISPCLITSPARVVVVDDSYFGEFGSSLSEYSQLLWLYDHFDAIVAKYDYIRIFQYRRFVAQNEFGLPCSQSWAKRIRVDELSQHSDEFSRSCASELFNRTVQFNGGMLGQYAEAHIREDIINFSKFLIEKSIFDPLRASLFLKEAVMIPSSNLGTFHTVTLREILSTLKRAAAFLRSSYFVPRPGYQRRVMGFLLERLTSFLIIMRIADRTSEPNIGHHIIISDDHFISYTE